MWEKCRGAVPFELIWKGLLNKSRLIFALLMPMYASLLVTGCNLPVGYLPIANAGCSKEYRPACYYAESGLLSRKYPITPDNVNLGSPEGTPLKIAVTRGDPERVSYLIAAGADRKLPGGPNWPYEYYLDGCNYFTDRADVMRRMFDAFEQGGIIPDYQELLINSAQRACKFGVQYAISHGANVNGKGKYGNTALHAAADCRDVSQRAEIVKMLIASGANIDVLDRSKDTAKMLMLRRCEGKYKDLIEDAFRPQQQGDRTGHAAEGRGFVWSPP